MIKLIRIGAVSLLAAGLLSGCHKTNDSDTAKSSAAQVDSQATETKTSVPETPVVTQAPAPDLKRNLTPDVARYVIQRLVNGGGKNKTWGSSLNCFSKGELDNGVVWKPEPLSPFGSKQGVSLVKAGLLTVVNGKAVEDEAFTTNPVPEVAAALPHTRRGTDRMNTGRDCVDVTLGQVRLPSDVALDGTVPVSVTGVIAKVSNPADQYLVDHYLAGRTESSLFSTNTLTFDLRKDAAGEWFAQMQGDSN